MRKIEKLHSTLYRSIFTTTGNLSHERVTEGFIQLCAAIVDADDTEEKWAIGEGSIDLASLVIGAYWHYTEWHAGQNSVSYAALCALGSIFTPGMSRGPEPDSAEEDTYNQMAELAAN